MFDISGSLMIASAGPGVFMAFLFLLLLGLAAAILLAVASKVFYVWEDPRIAKVEYELAGANCGGCGYPGCNACAAAIVAGKASPEACVAGGNECALSVGKVMGIEVALKEPEFAAPNCSGGIRATDIYLYEGAEDCRAQMLLHGGNKECAFACLGLGSCVKACPFDALKMGPSGYPMVNVDRCRACGTCAEVCPKGAIVIINSTAYASAESDGGSDGRYG